MRSDMAKVVVEQPRYGSRDRSLKTARKIRPVEVHEDFDSGPVRASSRRWSKSFGEHLTPLWRFLRSNLGRPWDKVYSEIRSQLDGRSVTGQHVLDHLRWEVETDTFLVDGKPMWQGWGGPQPVSGFYVHPKTGILREGPDRLSLWRREKRPKEVVFVESADGRLFQRMNEIWYRVSYGVDPESGKRHLVSKQQAGRKEVRWVNEQIQAAERGKKGYVRGTRSVNSPARGCDASSAAACRTKESLA
jgi:hypothetical protein